MAMINLVEQPGQIKSVDAAEALVKGRFVNAAGAYVDSGRCLGVTLYDCNAGEQASIAYSGIVVVEAGATIAAEDLVMPTTDGKADAVDPTTLAEVVAARGTAVTGASSGGYFLLRLH